VNMYFATLKNNGNYFKLLLMKKLPMIPATVILTAVVSDKDEGAPQHYPESVIGIVTVELSSMMTEENNGLSQSSLPNLSQSKVWIA